eukprot:c1646_g1_i1.p1 GENE.c1646_g1_i1~~c1646_g1_i1.p1  ORF type:complete len:505 (-),score=86.00 c1646_g1_i1:11-1525(-)
MGMLALPRALFTLSKRLMGSWSDLPPFNVTLKSFESRYSASCHCGRVRFDVSVDPVAAKICDCVLCAKLHGAPMQWAILFHKEHVRFRSIEFLKFYSPTEDANYDGPERELPCKLSCKHCGTWIADEGRRMLMTFPTIFDVASAPTESSGLARFPPSFHPQCHIFHDSYCFSLTTSLPKFSDDRRTPYLGPRTHLSPLADFLKNLAPKMDGTTHKGQAGRIAVLGGSRDYTGAPYYASMASLRIGAELAMVLVAQDAAVPIKSYTPELMVTPVYGETWGLDNNQQGMVDAVSALLPRAHSLVIGPGLGRDPRVLAGVAQIIPIARDLKLPMVLDADGLFAIIQDPSLITGLGSQVTLTPNAMEFSKLFEKVIGSPVSGDPAKAVEEAQALSKALGHVIIVRKGRIDIVTDGRIVRLCDLEGSPRRGGGIGDLLAGSIGALQAWTRLGTNVPEWGTVNADAAWAGCCVMRLVAKRAFDIHKRSTVASDMLNHIGPVFENLCPSDV